MTRTHPLLRSAVVASVLLAGAALARSADAQITRLSVRPDGAGSLTPAQVSAVSASDDGQYVAFISTASDLVAGDSNGAADVFLRDTVSGTTQLVTRAAGGGAATGGFTGEARISGDGRYVVFVSGFSNLVANDTNNSADVFLFDRTTNGVRRISEGVGGVQAPIPLVASPDISSDGKVVAYTAAAQILTGLPDGTIATVLFDTVGGTAQTVVTGPPTSQVPRQWQIALSGNGRYLAAATSAALVPADTNGVHDVYVHDIQTLAVTRVSVTSNGTESTAGGVRGSFHPSISADGRFVTFESDSSTLAPQSVPFNPNQVFIHDRTTATTTRISESPAGAGGPDSSYDARISSDGRTVAFHTFVPQWFSPANFSFADLLIWSRETGMFRHVNIPLDFVRSGSFLSASYGWPTDAGQVVFSSSQPNLVASDTNAAADVFVRSMIAPNPTLTSITPNSGPGGTQVTLSGTNFLPGSTALVFLPVGLAPVTPTSVTTTTAVATLPQASGTRTVSIATAHGVAGLPFTFTPCAYTVAPTSAYMLAGGGTVTLSITTAPSCNWTATTTAGFVQLAPVAGTGSGVVTATVAANATSAFREATVTIAGKTVSIQQAGTTGAPVIPAPGVDPTIVPVPITGGVATLAFSGVTSAGLASIDPLAADPPTLGALPAGLTALAGHAVDIRSTAAFAGVTVCLPYAEADLTASGVAEGTLRLLHLPTGAMAWLDITTAVDALASMVCGTTTSLSPFAIAGTANSAYTRYLAEGATSDFFDTQIALLNPGATSATATLRFLPGVGSPIVHTMPLPAGTRVTVRPRTIAGLEDAEFSTVVEADQLLVVDRTMTWGGGYGSHSETAVAAPSTIWYLAEGATHSGFQLFYLLQNPANTPTTVRVRYLRATGSPLEKDYVLPAQSRTNIWVNVEDFPGEGLALAASEFSAVVESRDATPIIVERAMYRSNQGRTFNAGHESTGVASPSTQWFLAEGATGPYFDLFVLIANPTSTDAQVRLTYLLDGGQTLTRTLTAPANARSGVWVDMEQFDGMSGYPLANVAVSTTVESLNAVPLVVERAMWWPGSGDTWHEAHNSAGATATGRTWAVAEGEVGGPSAQETYLLVANTSTFAGSATVTLYFEDGTSLSRTYALAPQSRTNVAVGPDFGAAVQNKRFGAVVQSEGQSPAAIVVERAMYSSAGGITWAAGTNALATRLR